MHESRSNSFAHWSSVSGACFTRWLYPLRATHTIESTNTIYIYIFWIDTYSPSRCWYIILWDAIMVQHNAESQHRTQLSISSPSKDLANKNRHVSSSIGCRKALVILAFCSAVIVILLQKPPTIVTSESSIIADDRSNGSRIITTKKNPIRLIAILGERNSGTRWTFE